MRLLAIFILPCLAAAFLMPPRPLHADGYHPERVTVTRQDVPPTQSPTPTPPEPTGGNPITQIINQVIQFPFENLVDALQNAAKSILTGTITPLESFFSASIGRWLTSSPGIITPGGGIANGDDVMGPAWRLMIKVAVLLWPLTLAIIAAIAAKDAVAAASWGIGDLKEALGGWLIAVVASATSLYWMDLANRFTNATTMTILNLSFTGEAGFQPNALTALVFGTAGLLLTWVSMPAALIVVIFVILMGLAVLSALVFQFLARFVILYLLVALAPVVIVLGVLPPVSWFRYMWLRGFVMVEAIGPINALLLKLVMILAVRGASNGPLAAFVNFIGAIGVLSILITVDGVIIKGVFGAAEEVMQKAVSTVQAMGTLALAGVTALAGGAIAGGALGGAGAATTGLAGSVGSGGAGAALPAASGTGGATGRTGAGAVGNPARTARDAFSPGAAMRGAGDVLYRQPGMLGSMGAAFRSIGGTMEQRRREDQADARWQAGQAGAQSPRPRLGGPGRGTPPAGQSPTTIPNAPTSGPSNPPGAGAPGAGSPASATSSGAPAVAGGNPALSSRAAPDSINSATGRGGAPNSNLTGSPATRGALPSTPAAAPNSGASGNQGSNSGISSGTLSGYGIPPPEPSGSSRPAASAVPSSGAVGNVPPGNVVPAAGPTSGPAPAAIPPTPADLGAGSGSGSNNLPPPQMPSVSPMGAPLTPSASPVNVPAPQPALPPQVASVVSLLPGPLGARAGDLAAVYANPRDQVSAAQAAVDAFQQVNARGQGFYDIGWQGAAWDRSMGPVLASARQGLPLETMAQDAGFGGNIGGYLAQRMLDNRQPSMDAPAQPVPWHPQMSPHDWETGAALSNALGNRISPGAAARVYHEVRSPESGGGWPAGSGFIRTVQESLSGQPADPLAALGARLAQMEAQGALSRRAMTLWRANVKGT